MLESPQKKPRLYGVTAFNSHAKNGMEADEMWERDGREGEQTKNKRWLDERVVCATQIRHRETKTLLSNRSMKGTCSCEL